MKQKSRPEDFCVEERTEFTPDGGPFALYRLAKQGLGTPEVIEAVAHRWRIDRRQVSFGGLKDRHASTVQWITIHRGPQRTLRQTHFELAYQGQASRPFEPKDIAGNRFRITLRELTKADVERIGQAIPAVARDGVPNYFDEQRFGSLGSSGEFIARTWCEGGHERGLWLAIAEPNPHDRPQDRKVKQLLREHWGNWGRCGVAAARSPWRAIVAWLADHPGDFRGATDQIRPDLRSLYVAAFQSHLWNILLAEWLRARCRTEQLIDRTIAGQSMPFPRSLDESQRAELAALRLPLPSARERLEEGPIKDMADRVLARMGLQWGRLRIKHPRGTFFSKGDRAAAVLVAPLDYEAAEDELYGRRKKVTLAFDLPRGSYATVLIKRLMMG